LEISVFKGGYQFWLNFRAKGDIPTAIFAWIDRPMNALPQCRLSSREVQF